MRVVEPLSRDHDREHFDCGVDALNVFLRQTARQHQERGISRTFVLTEAEATPPKPVLAFFTLAATEGFTDRLAPEIAKRLPAKIPAVVLARLAVSAQHQGQGYGSALLAEALSRVAAIADQLGVAGMFVDAKDEPAAAFYRKFGFVPLVSEPLRLFLPLASIRTLLPR